MRSSTTSRAGTTCGGFTAHSTTAVRRSGKLFTATPTVRQHDQHRKHVRRTGSSPLFTSLSCSRTCVSTEGKARAAVSRALRSGLVQTLVAVALMSPSRLPSCVASCLPCSDSGHLAAGTPSVTTGSACRMRTTRVTALTIAPSAAKIVVRHRVRQRRCLRRASNCYLTRLIEEPPTKRGLFH